MAFITTSIFSTNPPPPYFFSATSSPAKLSFLLCRHPAGGCPGRRKAAQVRCRKAAHDEWLEKLPDKKKPLYSHSLPCIEAWLGKLGFQPSREDRAAWSVEKPDWHAQLSLDVTDLYIRYLKSGPGDLEKDVERRFSYALSREDIENAILGGP